MSAPNINAACALTIVEAEGRILAKRWHANGTCEQYDRARTVNLHAHPVVDLAALADVLRDMLTQPRRCIVRGAPIDAARTMGVRRLVHPDTDTAEAPTLREVARQWVAVDLDSVAMPPGTDARDLAACARIVRRVLPAAFRDAAAIVTATASHGIKPGARLRWWAWLSRPTTGAELKAWFKGCPVDASVFGTAQPIYTAAPLFLDGADPLPCRLALLPGAPVARVPHPALLCPPPPRQPARTGLAARGAAWRDAAGLFERRNAARFDALRHAVRNAHEGTRHSLLFWAACRAGEMAAEGGIGAERAAAELVHAAMEGGGKDRRSAEATARDGIARGKGMAA